jgi:hypothetical protein
MPLTVEHILFVVLGLSFNFGVGEELPCGQRGAVDPGVPSSVGDFIFVAIKPHLRDAELAGDGILYAELKGD